MRLLAIFLIAGALSACVTPQPNPWDSIEVVSQPATKPLDCGGFPYPSEVIGESIVYDNSGANALEAYRACSEANEDIAAEHAQQIDQLHIATKGLVEAGQAQRRIADMRQQILEEERRHWFFERIGYWAGFLIIGAATL